MRIGSTAAESIRAEYRTNKADTESSFQTVLAEAANKQSGRVPVSSEQVMDAWNAAMQETGVDPLPMNKISTAMVIHVENGRQGSFSSFLGGSTDSAIHAVQQIINRLEHPIAPVNDVQFAKDELTFYSVFLNKLLESKTEY